MVFEISENFLLIRGKKCGKVGSEQKILGKIRKSSQVFFTLVNFL